MTPLFYACKQDNPDVIEYLVSKGAKINEGVNPLIPAIYNENAPIANILISKGINVNMKDDKGV
jgi:ankyrin repeat protein